MEMSEILDMPKRPTMVQSDLIVRGRTLTSNLTTQSNPTTDLASLTQSPLADSLGLFTTRGGPTKSTSLDRSSEFTVRQQVNATIQATLSEFTTTFDDFLTLDTSLSTDSLVNSSLVSTVSSSPLELFNSTLGAPQTLLPVSEFDLETASAQLLRVALWQWMSPFIFLLGFFGNIAILIVLQSRPVMSDNTTSTYVLCLAIADLCTLITGIIPEWLIFTHIFDIEEYHPVTCKFYKFFAYTASDASIWILAAFSVERFIAVVFPFKRQKGWCNVFQVKIICVGMVLLGVIKNFQSFWTRGAAYKEGENGTMVLHSNCGYPTEADVHFNLYIRPWLVLITVNIIPMLILWFTNFSVIWTISRRQTLQRLQLNMSAASKKASALTQQVTIMCLCASFSFIVFMTPSFILFIGKPYWEEYPPSKHHYLIAKAVNNQLMYINNSINFYLYLFSGERFRQSVISIFIKCQCKRGKELKSLSLHPALIKRSTAINSRGTPSKLSVITNNGVPQYRSTPEVSEEPSVCEFAKGSQLHLHGNNNV